MERGKYKRTIAINNKMKNSDYHKNLKGKNNPNFKNATAVYKCANCSKDVIDYKNYAKNKINHFCDKVCAGKWKYKYTTIGVKFMEKRKNSKLSENGNWRGGLSFEPYPLGWTKTFKEQIRYRDGYKCQICGKPEVECNRKLDVHHVDYNKKNLDPKNLISLCLCCHRKTNGNREYFQNLLMEKYNG